MHRATHRSRLLLALIVAAIGLVLSALPVSAQVNPSPTWRAWHLKVDFPPATPTTPQQPRVIVTVYEGQDNPPAVTNVISVSDISATCSISGQLTYQGSYAVFDGLSYIQCPLPAGASPPQDCAGAYNGPFWFAADVKLNQGVRENPIFERPQQGFNLSFPGSGANAKTRLALPQKTYTTSNWGINANGNRLLIGANGPVSVAAADHFGWLSFLQDPAWRGFFKTEVVGDKVGHWAEPQSRRWTDSPALLRVGMTDPNLYIGHSPTSGGYFTGKLRVGEIDPPGCRIQ